MTTEDTITAFMMLFFCGYIGWVVKWVEGAWNYYEESWSYAREADL